MKYVMLETRDGAKYPILFPDALTHSIMAMAAGAAIEACLKSKVKPVSAGFISLGTEVSTHGHSESLNMGPQPSDAARVVIGDSITHMPDKLAESVFEKIKEKR